MYPIKDFQCYANYFGLAGRLERPIISNYHLAFVLKGSLTYRINGIPYIINENDALIVPPGQYRERLPSDEPVHYVIFNFKASEPEKIPNTLLLKNSVTPTAKRLAGTYSYPFYNKNNRRGFSVAESNKLNIVLPCLFNCIITELLESDNIKTTNPHVIKGIKYINNHIHSPLTLSEISNHLFLTKEYTAKLFKKELDKTVSQYVNEQKLKEARSMITSTNIPLQNIALSLGYKNYGYFSKLFKSYFGVTPVRIKYEQKNSLEL